MSLSLVRGQLLQLPICGACLVGCVPCYELAMTNQINLCDFAGDAFVMYPGLLVGLFVVPYTTPSQG